MNLQLIVGKTTRRCWVPSQRLFESWTRAAVERRYAAADVVVSILVVGGVRSRTLNAHYRGQDKATNVLSFAGAGATPDGNWVLGELVICAPVVTREARERRQSRLAHWAHMTVHGVLHLQGWDHAEAAEALRMESREIQILDRLGFSNPYI